MKTFIRSATVLLVAILSFAPLSAQQQRREQGNLVIEDIPEIPQRIVERMRQYQNTRSASLSDWDPAGKGMLISTRFGETTQVHYVERPGGARRQLTFFSEPVSGARMSPDPSRNGFLYRRDVGGSEFYQIFYFNMQNGKSTLLTDGKSRNEAQLWSNQGDRFAYKTTKRNGRDWDLFLSDPDNPQQAKPILEEGGSWAPIDWSPDDKRLLVRKYVSTNESYFYVLGLASGQLTQINPTQEKISYGGAVWAKDGKGIYITSDQGSEFRRLKYYDLGSGKFTVLTGDIPWDVVDIELSRQGDKLAFTVNEGGLGKLYLLDTRNGKREAVSGIPLGQISGLNYHPDGSRLGLRIGTSQTAGDVYSLDLKNRSLTRWTYSEVGGMDTDSLTAPKLIHYETFDQAGGKPRKIPAFYYKPQKAKGPHPVLIYIHGGPASQSRPVFQPDFQYWVNELGIAVLAPNVRGSSGYGKSYLLLDNGFKREDTVKDIGKLLDWVAQQPELDASRVAVFGGSYGGYMVLASMTHFNDRLRAGIERYGISNFVTFLKNTKDYRRYLRRPEYGDERDPKMREFLTRISPTTNVDKITKPMFIAQGLNDPRVPVTESEQMVEAIRKKGSAVWYLLAKDEGHGFKKKRNLDYFSNAMTLFLETHLLK